MNIRITPDMVGKALGVPGQAIRVGLQLGKLSFGTCYKQDQGGKRYTYILYPEAVRQAIGDENYKEMMRAEAARLKQ